MAEDQDLIQISNGRSGFSGMDRNTGLDPLFLLSCLWVVDRYRILRADSNYRDIAKEDATFVVLKY